MKKIVLAVFATSLCLALNAQVPLRPDAFPPVPDTVAAKELRMASTVEELRQWDSYPTYSAYLQLMQYYVDSFPHLCHMDTIGHSINNRLILSMALHGTSPQSSDNPQFFYSSTIHGDELTGFYFMLRLIDTLLSGYGSNAEITDLLNSVDIYINPLANPDGTYYGGDATVAGAIRYNANWVDLNRNYPDPFGTDPLVSIQPENQAMMDYVSEHNFLLSANLHGGSEVMNYPWDSFTSSVMPVDCADWWQDVCRRFVGTCRQVSSDAFSEVTPEGYIAGGDWYVIRNGRQDYMNYHGTRELTMEVSVSKMLSTSQLDNYWSVQHKALINYIKEIYSLVGSPVHIENNNPSGQYMVYPNPTTGIVNVKSDNSTTTINLSNYPPGVYRVVVDGVSHKVVKL